MAAVLASQETDAERRHSKDLPHLSLSLESPPSSSPFPSPSSSFLPPPMPGAHEYASKLPIPKRRSQRESTENNGNANATLASVATAPAAVAPVNRSAQSPSPTNAPNVITNGSATSNTKIRTSTNTTSEEGSKHLEQLASAMDRERKQASGIAENRAKHASRASLNSSRPAPPSPSVSRRASGAHAHNPNNVSNSSHIYRESVSLSRAPSNAKNVAAAASAIASGAESPAATASKRRSRVIKIRDFAFPADDSRHTGQGPDAPRLDRSRPASEYGGDMLNSSRRNSGWGAFRWAGSKLWGFAIGGNGKQRAGASTDPDGFVPTSSDFARNFDVSSPQDEYPPGGGGFNLSSEADDSDVNSSYDPYDNDELSDYPDQDVPLLPGLYRAMYAFVPEGTAEMALAEDQVVRIIGRGGGVGWAVAEDENGNHALVPESYLEVVKFDENAEGENASGEGGPK